MGMIVRTLIIFAVISAHAQMSGQDMSGGVDYFGFKRNHRETKRQEKAQRERRKEIEELFGENILGPDGKLSRRLPPEHLLRLVEDPSPENAREYLRKDEMKVSLTLGGLAAIENAKSAAFQSVLKGVKIVWYSLEGCKWCDQQRQLFEAAKIDAHEVAVAKDSVPKVMKAFPRILIYRDDNLIGEFEGYTTLDGIVGVVGPNSAEGGLHDPSPSGMAKTSREEIGGSKK